MHQFEKLLIWQKAMDIVIDVYEVISEVPKDEKYNLIQQIKRSVVSIPSNIAEGSGRNSNNEFIHFLGIANGSSYELMTQLLILKRLQLIDEEKINSINRRITEITNMNYVLQKHLKNI